MLTKYNFITKQNLTFSNTLLNFDAYKQNYINFIYIRRFNYFNINQVPQVKNIFFKFKSLNLPTTLNLSLIANFFFLRYFTLKKPYFLPVKVISTFKKKIYHCICAVTLSKKDSFSFLGTRISYASNALSSVDFYPFFQSFIKSNQYLFILKNFTYISIVETHPVFFKWQEILEVTIKFTKELSRLEYILFFKLLKINDIKFLI